MTALDGAGAECSLARSIANVIVVAIAVALDVAVTAVARVAVTVLLVLMATVMIVAVVTLSVVTVADVSGAPAASTAAVAAVAPVLVYITHFLPRHQAGVLESVILTPTHARYPEVTFTAVFSTSQTRTKIRLRHTHGVARARRHRLPGRAVSCAPRRYPRR